MVSALWAGSCGMKSNRVSLCNGGGHAVKFQPVSRPSQHAVDVWSRSGIGGMSSVGLAPPAVDVDDPDPGRSRIANWQATVECMPKWIVLVCDGGGVYIDKFTRSRWNTNHAIGRGTLNGNTFEPNSGAGSLLTYKVRLRLKHPATGPGKGTFVKTFTSLTGTFGAEAGPAMATSSK